MVRNHLLPISTLHHVFKRSQVVVTDPLAGYLFGFHPESRTRGRANRLHHSTSLHTLMCVNVHRHKAISPVPVHTKDKNGFGVKVDDFWVLVTLSLVPHSPLCGPFGTKEDA